MRLMILVNNVLLINMIMIFIFNNVNINIKIYGIILIRL